LKEAARRAGSTPLLVARFAKVTTLLVRGNREAADAANNAYLDKYASHYGKDAAVAHAQRVEKLVGFFDRITLGKLPFLDSRLETHHTYSVKSQEEK
jgi:hypothetical protein